MHVDLLKILERVSLGELTVADASLALGNSPSSAGRTSLPSAVRDDLDFDLDRARRCGFPEVVYAPGKSDETLVAAFDQLTDAGQNCLATRCTSSQAAALKDRFPDVIHNDFGRTVRLNQCDDAQGMVAVVTAGTSDRPVAEEAIETLKWMNVRTSLHMDVGVAGPQRFLRIKDQLHEADVVIVVAGMEGALPSVVGGWMDCPVIGVPTSVGYGAAFSGVAALLGMLNSCASNVTVVNIDAGFKAGYVAGMIARKTAE
ncbi:MAG: nickel pincer cofactor biosynthesis protein LarB [Planctomycetaceae bacterium]|nr:nickel pincer cofactor biosynthesis protein LarB [Planctomycetaceae bacterium]